MENTRKNLSILFCLGLTVMAQVNMGMGIRFPTSMISIDDLLLLQRLCF